MKKQFASITLASVLFVSSLAAFVGCGDKGAKVSLSTPSPTCFVAGELTDPSITKDTFSISFDKGTKVSVELTDPTLATLTEKEVGETSATYEVSALKTGTCDVNFMVGGKVSSSCKLYVKDPYPMATFNKLRYDSSLTLRWNEAFSHDPVVLQDDDGKYYSYSTDNYGQAGYQVRSSDDLINWKYEGVAIPDLGSAENNADSMCNLGKQKKLGSGMQVVYDWISSHDTFSNVNTLWAPDVVKGNDGKYWLYGSWTTAFGSRRSVIFLCKSNNPLTGFTFDSFIVKSPNVRNDGIQANAIDASIFTDEEGVMWMSYGSFSDFRIIKIDSATGRRADDLTLENYQEKGATSTDYFGKKILSHTGIEGSVIKYHEDVGVYTGDIATADYDEAKMTYVDQYYLMGSADSLSASYNMRAYTTTNLNTEFSSANGSKGSKVGACWAWYTASESRKAYKGYDSLNFFVPGHNDMLTTQNGDNIIAYHNRVSTDGSSYGTHYLYTGLYAFNSKGELVISGNRYAGESLRKVTAAEITGVSDGNYRLVTYTSNENNKINYASDIALNSDGTISGSKTGSWKLYGDNYVYLKIADVEYYGVVMPAMTRQFDATGNLVDKGGLTISAVSASGGVYINTYFA